MSTTSSSVEEEYRNIMETLPKERAYRLYGGFWINEITLPSVMHFQKFFKSRPGDINLVTYPKCGTTWLKALVFSVLNRGSFSFENHPLLTIHPQKLVPFLHEAMPSSEREWEDLPTPRLFASHVPYSLLPESMKDIDGFNCKMIYLTRDPKDTCISMYFFLREIRQDPNIHFGQAFTDFCDGYTHFGPFWEHQMEYKRESLRRPDKVLFLNYEEMKESPEDHVRKIAEFLGKPFSEEEERERVVEEIVKLCSFDFLKELEVNKQGITFVRGTLVFNNSAFFRKGKVGDWKEYLTAEMAERIDKITQQKQCDYNLIN